VKRLKPKQNCKTKILQGQSWSW